MTYSQRLTQGNASDIIYLEHQIGVAEDELAKAEEEQRAYETDLKQLWTSPADSTSVTNVATEQELVDQLNKVQGMIETIRTRMKNLQDDLDKLEDE